MREVAETKFLTVAEVADKLAVSKPTIYRRIWAGDIPAVRVSGNSRGGPIRVAESELNAWVFDNPKAAA